LEQRQHFCLEELRMNQPIAPEIYLEVLSIAEIDGKLVLGDAGQAVEYALKMCQFPQEALFITMFEQGQLTETHMEDLGRIVAQFHAKAETNDYIRSFGEVSKIREAFDENYQQTEKYIGGPQTQQQYEETKNFSDTFFFNSRPYWQHVGRIIGFGNVMGICI
jgi:aminoglycoside phosphotransferase family enzyme